MRWLLPFVNVEEIFMEFIFYCSFIHQFIKSKIVFAYEIWMDYALKFKAYPFLFLYTLQQWTLNDILQITRIDKHRLKYDIVSL